jgi:hypothetical protein
LFVCGVDLALQRGPFVVGPLLSFFSVNCVMTNRTQRNKVVFRISTTLRMMLFMMQFEMPRIRGVPLLVGPTAPLTSIFVSNKRCAPNRVGNLSIMRGALSVFFQ